MTSTTGVIGYIGGVDWEGIWQFQAGYEAGARAVDPNIEILAKYLSVGNFSGFLDEEGAREVALGMYDEGADVIFAAAGNSGLGLFQAATDYSLAESRHVWAIGVDTDQYQTVRLLPGQLNAEAWRAHILTSVVKGIDVGIYDVLAEWANGTFKPGVRKDGLETGFVGLAYSGGYIDDFRAELEALATKIIAGEIDVPCIPEDRLDAATELGIGPDDCHD
jgi:basic membrane protein A